ADTDKEHNIEGKDTEIMQILEKFAIERDLVYHQSEHLNIHQTLAIRLLQEGKAFICECVSQSRCKGTCETLNAEGYQSLKAQGNPFVIRLKQSSDAPEIDSVLIMRTDNTPTHTFASACDDMLSNIDTIIETEEQLNDMPLQRHIKAMLGYDEPTHCVALPTLSNSEDVSIQWLFEEGFIPDAILNYLLLLGNSHVPQEIFTLPEAIEWFNLDAVSRNDVRLDIEKLRLINREHLKMMDDKTLSKLFGFADADIGRLAKVYLDAFSTLKELDTKIKRIFAPKNFDNAWGESMRTLESIIMEAPAFDDFNALVQHITQTSTLTEEQLDTPLRLLLTGEETGPELWTIYPYIKSYLLEVAS
ncbi:MAG TPA: glutamate--tRNA ligase, partial [Campylobacterales bacterium]|nr:glutamate--tRNA ligase [Campylobacterales bacterium]